MPPPDGGVPPGGLRAVQAAAEAHTVGLPLGHQVGELLLVFLFVFYVFVVVVAASLVVAAATVEAAAGVFLLSCQSTLIFPTFSPSNRSSMEYLAHHQGGLRSLNLTGCWELVDKTIFLLLSKFTG